MITTDARIAELEAKLYAAEVEIERVWAIARGLDRFADGHELGGEWLEELKALKKAVEKKDGERR